MAAPMVQRTAWTANRTIALIIGIVFTILGIAGLILTPTMAVRNMLGFDVDIVHSIFHLVTGLLGLIAAFTGWSRLFNQIFGVVYLIIGLAGLVYPGLYSRGLFLSMMHNNVGDHILHLVTGAIAACVGYFVRDYTGEPMTATADRNRVPYADRDQSSHGRTQQSTQVNRDQPPYGRSTSTDRDQPPYGRSTQANRDQSTYGRADRPTGVDRDQQQFGKTEPPSSQLDRDQYSRTDRPTGVDRDQPLYGKTEPSTNMDRDKYGSTDRPNPLDRDRPSESNRLSDKIDRRINQAKDDLERGINRAEDKIDHGRDRDHPNL
ncbi:DUF4383 domain-containing protein [Ktedonospora formicarum]|uniref:DUF4383 domain-containing protein n=1 Tax=Ktedonospora formicarum TaxID=2778364 RepID=A0A8J3MU59_9CHLR|nr:DUF4383 domain-containing protein [Ktedonospora formicarum]GHO46601.1 hypothetical protein KSX_47640 [Ktedonospora formicarum]